GEPAVGSSAAPDDGGESPRRRAGRAAPASSRPAARNRGARAVTTAALAAFAVMAAVGLIMRATVKARNGKGPEVATTASVAEPAAPSQRATTVNSRPGRTSVPAVALDPASEASASIPTAPYTLDTNVLLDQQTALAERARMQALTGIEGWVVPASQDGQYRITLGVFRSYGRAKAAA